MFNIFNIFKKRNIFSSGANIDIRLEEDKNKDYLFEEMVTSVAPVAWIEKVRDQWKKYPIFNQDGSGSCVAQTMAKMMGILYYLKNNVYVHFSATHIFQRRANRPATGMGGVDAFKIAQEGVTLEVLVPSQKINDSVMDGTVIDLYKKEVGEIFKIGNYITLPIKDIETVASVIQTTQKPVMVWFYFEISEWNKEVPQISNYNLDLRAIGTNRHSVTAVDFTLYKGKKAIIIEDSWGFWNGFTGRRIITEDFFRIRNYFAAYTINFKFDESNEQEKPKYVFNVNMQFGHNNDEVKRLQDVLKYEGFFPENIESTGYFGSITLIAVQKFQLKHKVVANETSSGYGMVGPKTRAKLNSLYN